MFDKISNLTFLSGFYSNRETMPAWMLSLVISLSMTLSLLLINSTGLFQIFEWAILDQYFRQRPTEKIDQRLLIVTVDEPDISQLREWPLSDLRLAKVLEQINQYEPRVIGLDIYRDFSVEPGKDVLESFFHTHDNIIGVEKVGHTPVPAPEVLAQKGQVAMADLVMDSDGKVRRALLSAKFGDELKLTLGAALALRYLQEDDLFLEVSSVSGSANIGDVSFPSLRPNDGGYVNADAGGSQIFLNYRGPDDAFETVSVIDVLEGKLNENQVRDRMVLIGSIAPSLNDFLYTPYATSQITKTTQSPGVAVHGHIASQIVSAVLDDRPLIRSLPTFVEWAWVFVWCNLGSSLILIPRWHRNNRLITFVFLMTLPVIVLMSSLLLLNGLGFFIGWWIPSVPSLLGIVVSATVSLTASNSKLLNDAYVDGLTKVLNRRAFDSQIDEAQRYSQQVAVVLCDVDFFKGFNDLYGHQAGDVCLQQVAKAIQRAVRSQDVVARYGGEEFVAILRDVREKKAADIADDMRQKVQSCCIDHGASQVSAYVSISCGVAVYPSESSEMISTTISQADQALYAAKRSGRNKVVLWKASDSETVHSTG